MTILILGILGFISYFIVETILESRGLNKILNAFIWNEKNASWKNFGSDFGTELTSEYTVYWSHNSDIDQLSLLPNQLTSTSNIVFDRNVSLKNPRYTDETVSAEYTISNNIADIQEQEIRVINPAILRYLDEAQTTSTSELWVYVITRLFQDRTKGLDRLKLSYAVQKIFLEPSFTISKFQEQIETKYGYNSVNFQRVFLDAEFGLFTPDGLFFWLETLYFELKKDNPSYEYNRNLLKNRISWSDSFNIEDLIDFIYDDLGLTELYKSVMKDYEQKIKGMCGKTDCTDEQMNLLQWGSNVYNRLLSNNIKSNSHTQTEDIILSGAEHLQKNFNVSHVVTLDLSDTTDLSFSLEESTSLILPSSKNSILNMENNKFLESQIENPDTNAIMQKFELDSTDKAMALFKYYQKVYTTLTNYSDRYQIDYLKSEFTQSGLLKALNLTTSYTLNNITSIKLRERITKEKLTCREVFNVMPYLDMCTHKELNIEYRDVISLFISAYFDLPEEKSSREEIKNLMNQNDVFIKNLFSGDSMLKFNELLDSILNEIGSDFQCTQSCRTVLGQAQFVYSQVFQDYGVESLQNLPGNEDIIQSIPEIGAYLKLVIKGIVL